MKRDFDGGMLSLPSVVALGAMAGTSKRCRIRTVALVEMISNKFSREFDVPGKSRIMRCVFRGQVANQYMHKPFCTLLD
jgi:hypothetical protein